MKKYPMAAVALICMTMACVTLTACSSDDKVAEKYRSLITGKITLSMGVASSNPDATNLVVIKTYSFPY
jgi:ABC-type uncharacterized transport system auxiliary subunit